MSATVQGIHLYGNYADIPAAGTPPIGSLYSAADTAKIYITDGSSWAEYADLAGIASLDSGIDFIIDGAGGVIGTGYKGAVLIPFDCTITSATLLADQSGSIVVDLWVDEIGNYPPTDADSITGTAVPTIGSATYSTNSTLTGWTTSLTLGDILGYNVDSCSTITRCTVALTLTRV